MFNRPRCRDWTPLATQQLRLRNLIRITGHDVVCQGKCKLYFTLHATTMSAPFYTSEKIEPHGSSSLVDWPEINCQAIIKSTAQFVCIRVWEHEIKDDVAVNKSKLTSNTTDKMLFLWGVYFSGLVLITKRSEAKFFPNSLAFQMHGGCFTSPERLQPETVRQQLRFEMEAANSIPSIVSRKDASVEGEVEKNVIKTAVKSCDIEINSSISFSESTSSQKRSSRTTRPDSNEPSNADFQINSPRTSRSCSPERSTIGRASNQSSAGNSVSLLRTRYLDRNFLPSEIRPSYNLSKLLQLQEIQRKSKYNSETVAEVTERICTKSAFCLNLELISHKGVFYRQKGNPSMGRTLNRLLFQETHASPQDILKAQDLRRLIETARFRTKLLRHERDRSKVHLRNLGTKLDQLHDNNIEQGSWLMSSYRSLGKEKGKLLDSKMSLETQRDYKNSVFASLKLRRSQLCSALREIYAIKGTSNGIYSINNVILPNSGHLHTNDKLSNGDNVREPILPLSLSVALGYVAHAVQMSSIILDLPLRNPIKYEGSRSKILDIVKDIPDANREFPLYSRTSPPPRNVLYGVYLLNLNIAQLVYQVTGKRCVLADTLPSLLELLSRNISQDCTDRLSVPKIGLSNQVTSTSGSSVDNEPPSIHLENPISVIDRIAKEDQRISRSVGSYSEENLSSSNSKTFYSSEPILVNLQKKVNVTSFSESEQV